MSFINKISNIRRLFTDHDFFVHYLTCHGMAHLFPDEKFLKSQYRFKTGRELNLEEPCRFTEKLQWLKLYDHRPEYTVMVDKYLAKDYVAQKIGAEYVIPMLAVWDTAEDIDFDNLPDRFVLKTTHDSGTLLICKDKSKLDFCEVRKQFKKYLKRKYFNQNREWPYKNVKPRIIAEKYMEDSKSNELRDYKFFTFGGEPKVLYVAQGRGTGGPTVADFFDMDYNHLDFTIDHDMAPVPPEKPECFELMKELAAKLSQGTPQLRVDFYEVDGRVYFGEMTFFHCSGMESFHPDEWDKTFGSWVKLPDKTTD